MADDAESRMALLESDNRRLRELLGKRDAPGELRHRLRSTMATLRTVIRMSADTKSDVQAYAAHLEDRMDAIMRAQAAADEDGAVNLQSFLANELLMYGAKEDERLKLSGSEVSLPPRQGQVFALAIHELAVNAVEHGALSNDQGRIEVTTVQNGASAPELTFVWKETNSPGADSPSESGFGTEVLIRALSYELNAKTEIVYEPDGIRCTIRFPLPPSALT